MKVDEKSLTKWIRSERRKRKWSQQQLGKIANIDHTSISNYECGKHLPRIDVICSLAAVFGYELQLVQKEETCLKG